MQEIVIPLPTGIDSDLTDRVKRRAVEHFGGFTTHRAEGGWKSPDGDVITENVEVLTVVADESDETPAESWAKATARHVASESDESAVMWFVRQIAAGGMES
jgi:hypothetical protein